MRRYALPRGAPVGQRAGRPRRGSARRRGPAPGERRWNASQLTSVSSSGAAAALAHARDHPAREAQRALGVVVQRGDELAEARVVLGQPVALGVQRLGDPGQLLERREVPVADDGRGRDGEVDRAEQLVVELGLLAGEVRRRRGRQPDHVRRLARGGQLAERGAHDVAPQRREVVALVEHHRADLRGGAAGARARARAAASRSASRTPSCAAAGRSRA